MKIKTWNPEMTDAESKDLAYWERNMLALKFADGWYNDDVRKSEIMKDFMDKQPEGQILSGIFQTDWSLIVPRFEGWRRVLTLDGGAITFHIPDEFEVGNLPEIPRNWDGHSTEEKWQRIADGRGIQ